MSVTAVPVEKTEADSPTLSHEWIRSFLESGSIVSSNDTMAWVGWGEANRSARASERRLSVFAPDFMLEDREPWTLYEFGAEIEIESLIQALAPFDRAPVESFEWNQPSREPFAREFEDLQRLIVAGVLSKAVPVIARTSPNGLDIYHRASVLRKALRVTQGFPMTTFGFWTTLDDPGGQGMIGATPEILFRQNGLLRTMALAGTRRVDSTEGSLLDDPKELLEHRFVIEGIASRLEPFGEVRIGETSELRLPSLIHLHTPIEVAPAFDVRFEEWVTALHPTPAIGAWPLEEGWTWLRAQPIAKTRRRFGAPFGMIAPNHEEGKCVVAIRNVQWTANESMVLAGCGIVGPSKLDREWSELHAKLDAVQEALGL
jgi:menaquinone-specific isochorismate synthase